MRPGPARSAPPLPANREWPLRRQAWEPTWVIITPREEYCQVPGTKKNGEACGSPFECSPLRPLLHVPDSGLQEGQQVGVDCIGLGRGHAVRKALVGFQGAILQQLCRQ